MKGNKLEKEQLSEAVGGAEAKAAGSCSKCGKKETVLYLQMNGGLCRTCAAMSPAAVCPYCGGMPQPIPGAMYINGQGRFMCGVCGKEFES